MHHIVEEHGEGARYQHGIGKLLIPALDSLDILKVGHTEIVAIFSDQAVVCPELVVFVLLEQAGDFRKVVLREPIG